MKKNPFNNSFKHFSAFEFEFIYDELFFEGLKVFLEQMENQKVCFYTIEPSPEEYFYNRYRKYSIFEITTSSPDVDLNNIMTKDPTGDSEDSICTSSDKVCWFSKSDKWAILASRDWEIAIAGFSDLEVKEKFMASFTKDVQTMFTSVQEQVNILDEMLGFSTEVKVEYQKLIESYSGNRVKG